MLERRPLNRLLFVALSLGTMLALLLAIAPTQAAPDKPETPADWTVVASGLSNPRGLTWGPDGALYIAEAGKGGNGTCIPGPEGGDVCFGTSGAVTRVTMDVNRQPTAQEQVVTGLPSLGNEGTGENASGPSAVAFHNGDMYVLTGLGGPPSLQDPGGPLGADGANFGWLMSADPVGDSFTKLYNIAAYEASENPEDSAVDTNPFDLILNGDNFVVVDAGGNDLLNVDGNAGNPANAISTLAVFPPRMVEFPPGTGNMMPMDAVPTSVKIGPDGAYYVSQLTGFPFPPGGANIWRVEAAGSDPEVYVGGFTNILDLDFAADGSLYVLEMFTNSLLSGDPTGRIVRVGTDGSWTTVAREGLIVPTAMSIGPDQALYVANVGTSAGDATVVRIPTVLSEATQFTALLGGGQESPPVDTDATGVARFSLSGNMLHWDMAVQDITDITAAHIHLAPVGNNGPVVFTLYDGTGTFDPETPISGMVMLDDAQKASLLAGDFYVNVHTTAHGSGEIRGQIWPAHTLVLGANLAGGAEVPPVDTAAGGKAYYTLSPDLTKLYYRLVVFNIEDVTAAHIHSGKAGANGPVLYTLYPEARALGPGEPVDGMVEPSLVNVAAMLAGNTYTNVHTAAHGGGEIRGQNWQQWPGSSYEATLNGWQEVPPVDTPAMGHGWFTLSKDLSQIDYKVTVSDIADISASHLHTGWPGQNGPVAITLYGGGGMFGPDMPLTGLAPLDAQNVLDLISGYYYANVHTAAHGSGEIRGQVYNTPMGTFLPAVARN